jgi:hypothetical protein
MRFVGAAMALLMLAGLCGCGGGHGSVGNSLSLAIIPSNTTLAPGGIRGFQYVLSGSGTAQTGVVWSVKEAGGGTIDNTGLYTAPTTPGTYHVVVTSVANPAVSATATVTVGGSGPLLTVTQRQVVVAPSSTVSLASDVTVSNASNPTLLWSVMAPNLGTVDANGNYTAPSTPGDYYVTVSLQSDPSQTDYILVEVVGVTLTISPTSVQMKTNQTYGFGYNIQVIGSTNNKVTWAVTDKNGNPVSGDGTIDQNGNYTAPSTPGTYYVTVFSQVRPDIKATATVTVS